MIKKLKINNYEYNFIQKKDCESTWLVPDWQSKMVDISYLRSQKKDVFTSSSSNMGDLSVKIFGNFHYSDMLPYLIKRFGLPKNSNHDPDKQIIMFILNTPMKNVYLGVSPNPSGSYFSFYYYISESINKKLHVEKWTPICDYENRFKEWVKNQYGDIYFNKYLFDKKPVNKCYEKWFKENSQKLDEQYPNVDNSSMYEKQLISQDIYETFLQEKDLIFTQYKKEYNDKIEKQPNIAISHDNEGLVNSQTHKSSWDFNTREEIDKNICIDEFRNGSVSQKVQEAFMFTMIDLLRPVCIRDVGITLVGKVGSDLNNELIDLYPQFKDNNIEWSV